METEFKAGDRVRSFWTDRSAYARTGTGTVSSIDRDGVLWFADFVTDEGQRIEGEHAHPKQCELVERAPRKPAWVNIQHSVMYYGKSDQDQATNYVELTPEIEAALKEKNLL